MPIQLTLHLRSSISKNPPEKIGLARRDKQAVDENGSRGANS
jgi:hypothetical protein